VREAEAKARNPFIFKPALSQILKHETVAIKASVLPMIGTILHQFVKHLQSELSLVGINYETLVEEDF
jgi:hypothetical protein